MKKTITFKEVFRMEDLEECFLLRYNHYEKSQHRIFLKRKDKKIDIDEFDVFCRHWAVFDEDEQIVGYARIIEQEINTKILYPIKQILKKHAITNVLNAEKQVDFPLLVYQTKDSKHAVQHFLQKNSNAKIVELSRFIIKNGSSVRVSKFMVDSGLGIYKFNFKLDSVLLTCSLRHEKFWKHYGFTRIKENEQFDVGGLDSLNLHSDLASVNRGAIHAMERYAHQFALKNEISIQV